MNYYNLKAMVAATKSRFTLASPTESFFVVPERINPYIEPSFEKVEYETERPAVILVSAVGVTGKTALAKVLSRDIGLPLLDLAKHKPVADYTLTGLLHDTFQNSDASDIFLSIATGTYGVIIDAVDEGRSKTTDKGFDAFLDDIARLCVGTRNTSFVLLGRPRILEDCWLYLTEKGTPTGLITISPFDLPDARKYIDAFTESPDPYQAQYDDARDKILNVLGTAFAGETEAREKDFLSFIGYPPVLDSIVTLLGEEQNYHKLSEELQGQGSEDVEIRLLQRIADYILRREKEQKVVPNILKPLVAEATNAIQEQAIKEAFENEEQCMRLVSFCLNRELSLEIIDDVSINDKYEAQLRTWLLEHPFLNGREFRNPVFESVVLATLMASGDSRCQDLVLDYVKSHRYTYHLVYLLSIIASDGYVPIQYLHIVVGSALEFWSRSTAVELKVIGPEFGELEESSSLDTPVEIEIEIVMGQDGGTSKTFEFQSKLSGSEPVELGDRLSAAYVSLPCEVILAGNQELELDAPVAISAKGIHLRAKTLVLKHSAKSQPESGVFLEADTIDSTLESIVANKVPLRLSVSDMAGQSHPIIQYAEKRPALPSNVQLREKYIRLKRILVELRSHSQGGLARYKEKIESERVLRNELGKAILRRLISDGILMLIGNRYFLQTEAFDEHLAISWPDLQRGQTSSRLLEYLRSID